MIIAMITTSKTINITTYIQVNTKEDTYIVQNTTTSAVSFLLSDTQPVAGSVGHRLAVGEFIHGASFNGKCWVRLLSGNSASVAKIAVTE